MRDSAAVHAGASGGLVHSVLPGLVDVPCMWQYSDEDQRCPRRAAWTYGASGRRPRVYCERHGQMLAHRTSGVRAAWVADRVDSAAKTMTLDLARERRYTGAELAWLLDEDITHVCRWLYAARLRALKAHSNNGRTLRGIRPWRYPRSLRIARMISEGATDEAIASAERVSGLAAGLYRERLTHER